MILNETNAVNFSCSDTYVEPPRLQKGYVYGIIRAGGGGGGAGATPPPLL